MEKFLTTKMTDMLRDKDSDLTKRKKRDGSNVLLSSNLDKIVLEESKIKSDLNQMGTASCHECRFSIISDFVSSGG